MGVKRSKICDVEKTAKSGNGTGPRAKSTAKTNSSHASVAPARADFR